jgi:hypothetical protein
LEVVATVPVGEEGDKKIEADIGPPLEEED